MPTPASTAMVADHLPEAIVIEAGEVRLPGVLTLPPHPLGLVLLARGSGRSRFSERNRFVANALAHGNFGTLLFDLLTEAEAQHRANVFDIGLLAERLRAATDWVARYPATADLAVGYFGSSTGAAAALVAAARKAPAVRAIVSRGGRPDLAGDYLSQVKAATLLIVGGADFGVLELNRAALPRLGGIKRLVVIPGATHLFEEPGALENVAGLAAFWFGRHLGSGAAAAVRKAS